MIEPNRTAYSRDFRVVEPIPTVGEWDATVARCMEAVQAELAACDIAQLVIEPQAQTYVTTDGRVIAGAFAKAMVFSN